ncbi:MAG: sulfur oxidation c-type cytochrome SoxX [Chromatiales bacterium]|jgi:sulfur-oxidizing protein SoxX|nr:sulfur oxidation c-type cytochrome SoxX [Chromatiales bacterium]MDX9767237.1 sulfur oxidation c-type cytochrome SoxX [Ectothiorhodospiraceae bacterium]
MKHRLHAIAFACLLVALSPSLAQGPAPRVETTTVEAHGEWLLLESGGLDLSGRTQEGRPAKLRMQQDEMQKQCSRYRDRPPPEVAQALRERARRDMNHPSGDIPLGDWRKGAELARSGFGFRIGAQYDDHAAREPGGNCYACHALSPRELAYGSIGPSLTGYGTRLGDSQAVRRFVYEMIHDPTLHQPCSAMPRFGRHGFLTREQITHLMAYLLDPQSPVNQP